MVVPHKRGLRCLFDQVREDRFDARDRRLPRGVPLVLRPVLSVFVRFAVEPPAKLFLQRLESPREGVRDGNTNAIAASSSEAAFAIKEPSQVRQPRRFVNASRSS